MNAFHKRFIRNPGAAAGSIMMLLVAAMALSAPLAYPDGPWEMAGPPLRWPLQDWAYPLGTDVLGRDILAGIFHGARVSLGIGIVATILSLLIGVTIGAIGGYFGTWIDDLLGRLTEIFQTMPFILFAMVVVAITRPSVETIVLAIGLVTWPPVARLVRAEFIALKERDFVQASIGTGMSDTRIMVTEILPNAMAPIIVIASVKIATAILTESSLAFLGLGDPNAMSWGTMIGAARDQLRTAWYLTAIPGMVILLTVVALNLIGEGLNDALNPRLKLR